MKKIIVTFLSILNISICCFLVFAPISTANKSDELSDETIQVLVDLLGQIHMKLDDETRLHQDHNQKNAEYIDYHFGKMAAYTDIIILINDIIRNGEKNVNVEK